jgi:chromosome segregation ATPase
VRLLGIAPAVLIAFLIGQVRPSSRPKRGRADAGAGPILLGTDPPGRIRPQPPSPADAGGPERDAGADELHRELQQLRTRLDALERERALAQQTAQQLQQLTQEVQLLRQQIADAEARRVAAEQQRDAQQAAVQSGLDSLYAAQQRLAAGNYAIEAELDRAQATFTGQALRDVQAARSALQNRDLAAARALLAAAISDARAGR